jgi:orotate phosphoribosyltransferase
VRDALAPTSKGVWDNVSYSFYRKEAKDHGEEGNIVGAPLKGKSVLIVDDVITAGTALREAVGIVEKEGGIVAGMVILFNREERVSDAERQSAVGIAEKDLSGNDHIRAVLYFADLFEKLDDKLTPDVCRSIARNIRPSEGRTFSYHPT